MIISAAKDGSLRIQNGETVLLVDPGSNRSKGDIVLQTEAPLETQDIPESGYLISLPGEYEVGGIEIQGFQHGTDGSVVRTAYAVQWDGIRLAIVRGVDPLPVGEALEGLELRQPEVVLFPMDTPERAEWSAQIAKQLEASVIMPSSPASEKTIASVFGETPTAEEKFTFKKKDLAEYKQRLVVLSVA